jgi:hypothetical protein
MSERQDAHAWAEAEFRGVPRLEKRLQDRLVDTASCLAQRPDGTLPQRLDWAELKGVYRLIDDDRLTHDTLQAVHRQRTRDRMDRDNPVLIIHDGTEHDFSSHKALADQLGPIGNGGCRGLLQHNSLAIDAQSGELLGLIHQQTFTRQPTPAGETRLQRQQRQTRESAVWAAGIRAVGPMPSGCCWIHVGDRGADCFEAMATARLNGCHFLIRLCQDRRVGRLAAGEDGACEHLMTVARGLTAEITDVVEVASKGGRPARQAQVCLASTRVRIASPVQDKKWKGHCPLAVTVIRIWEPNPPAGVAGLEWVLGTDCVVREAKDLLRYRDWYVRRWRTAEEYHKVQKSGCRIEDLRFETKPRLLRALSLLSVVAVRVLSLRWRRDADGESPVGVVASELEVAVVEKASRSGTPLATVRQFVDAVAKLGGYLGRKCDGPPGWQSLWRGYQRLADMLLGMELAQQPQNGNDKLPRLNTSG